MRGKRGLCMVELLIGLSLGATLLAAVASAVYGMSYSVRVNQAQLRAVRLGQNTMGYLTTQLRRADSIDSSSWVLDASRTTASPTSVPVTQFSMVFDGTMPGARSDCNPGDYLLVTIKQVTQNGATSLQVAKNGLWNGTQYDGTSWAALPAIVAGQFDCQMDPNNLQRVIGVTLNLTARATETGQTIDIPLTGVVQICRAAL